MKNTLALIFCLALLACKDNEVTAALQQQSDGAVQSVTVLETIDVGSYTYIRAATAEGETWIATSPVSVSVGDEIEYNDSALMVDFFSPTLNRSFDRILFVGQVRNAGSSQPARTTQALPPGPGADHPVVKPGSVAAVPPADLLPLEGGQTIAAIHANRASLEGSTISLRAQVVKFSPDILNTNWVTLSDGTGEGPESRLTAKTAQTVQVGDVVVVTGTVRNDVSLGYGYDYEVLLEEAAFH